jgi:hypothetical protein
MEEQQQQQQQESMSSNYYYVTLTNLSLTNLRELIRQHSVPYTGTLSKLTREQCIDYLWKTKIPLSAVRWKREEQFKDRYYACELMIPVVHNRIFDLCARKTPYMEFYKMYTLSHALLAFKRGVQNIYVEGLMTMDNTERATFKSVLSDMFEELKDKERDRYFIAFLERMLYGRTLQGHEQPDLTK